MGYTRVRPVQTHMCVYMRRAAHKTLRLVLDEPPPVADTARCDGRGDAELRRLLVRTGVLPKASGSAYVEMGETKVLCAIFGPQQADGHDFLSHGRLECTVKFSAFARRTTDPAAATTDASATAALSASLSAALSGSVQLDQYPKSLICVHAMVLQDGGGALPALVSCGSAALAHARLKLYGLVAACGAAIPDEGSGRVLLDPSASEERAASSRLVAATVPELSHLPLLEQEGRAQFEAVAAALRHALGGAATVHERMREALLAEGQTASSARKRSRGGGGAVDAAA